MTQTQTKLPGPLHQPPAGSTKLVVVSLSIALAAVLLTNLYIDRVKKIAQEQGIKVFLLKHSVKEGQKLNTKDWETVNVPISFKDDLQKIDVIVDIKQLENKVGNEFVRGAPQGALFTTTLFERRVGEEDHTKIEKGKVLVSLPIDSTNQPGTLRPLMIVDIAAPFPTGGQIPEVLTVMERVTLFALGRHTGSGEDDPKGPPRIGNYRSITIEVKPEIARQLTMIQKLSSGDFVLLVRNPGDDDSIPEVPADRINPRVLELLKSRLPKGTVAAQAGFQ